MKKLLISATIAIAALTAIPAQAYSCSQQVNGISGLSDETKQSMIVSCEQNKLKDVQAPKIGSTTVEEMDKWSDVSLKFAKAIGVAAKEFGVAVNDFLETDAGKLTAVFIGWQVLGDDISYVGISIIVLIFALGTTNKLRKTIRLSHYAEKDKFFLGKKIGTEKAAMYSSWGDLSSETAFLIVCTHLIEIVLFIVILANF